MGSTKSASPVPIQIMKTSRGKGFELDSKAIESILLDETCRDRPVALVSIAGDFRKGKSFMLNFFLRYLKYLEAKQEEGGGPVDDPEKWLGGEDEPLTGFVWEAGVETKTTGILMWPEPFVIKTGDEHKEVAVILMDTQGLFDSEASIKKSTQVFALSTLTSSVLIYNLHFQIQENDLEHLQFFVEYGRLASENDNSKHPFQKLLFLVRDWQNRFQFSFGVEGGNKYLTKKMTVTTGQPEEAKHVRERLHSCFEDIECFLMPHPGEVVEDPDFDGRISELKKAFVEQVGNLVPCILSPSQLIPKTIGGQVVTGQQLAKYFEAYAQALKRDGLFEPKSLLAATEDAFNAIAIDKFVCRFEGEMEALVLQKHSPSQFEVIALDIKNKVIADFTKNSKLMGDASTIEKCAKSLHGELDKSLKNHVAKNKAQWDALIADAKSSNEEAIRKARSHLKSWLELLLANNAPFLNAEELERKASEYKKKAVAIFDEEKKTVNGACLVEGFLRTLNADLDDLIAQISAQNNEAIKAYEAKKEAKRREEEQKAEEERRRKSEEKLREEQELRKEKELEARRAREKILELERKADEARTPVYIPVPSYSGYACAPSYPSSSSVNRGYGDVATPRASTNCRSSGSISSGRSSYAVGTHESLPRGRPPSTPERFHAKFSGYLTPQAYAREYNKRFN